MSINMYCLMYLARASPLWVQNCIGVSVFQFFLQGTQLQQIQDDYNALEQSMSVSEDIISKKKKV